MPTFREERETVGSRRSFRTRRKDGGRGSRRSCERASVESASYIPENNSVGNDERVTALAGAKEFWILSSSVASFAAAAAGTVASAVVRDVEFMARVGSRSGYVKGWKAMLSVCAWEEVEA